VTERSHSIGVVAAARSLGVLREDHLTGVWVVHSRGVLEAVRLAGGVCLFDMRKFHLFEEL
jgi:hypothetical protein